MKTRLHINILMITVMFLSFGEKAWGQSEKSSTGDCANSISKSNTYYKKEGSFQKVIQTLEPCLSVFNDKNQLKYAYRILGHCYLKTDQEKKADEAVKQLLLLDHFYQLYPDDEDVPVFSKLVNSFKVTPKLSLGIMAGFNYSMPYVSKKGAYAIKPADIKFQGGLGQRIGLFTEYYLKDKHYSIKPWAGISTYKYSETVNFNEFESIVYKEDFNLLNFGLGLRYKSGSFKKINPYAGIGLGYSLFLKGFSNQVFTNTYLQTREVSSRVMDKWVKKNYLSGVFDLGANVNLGRGVFGLDLQYTLMSGHIEDRYADIEKTLSDQWVDSDIHINYMSLTLSYSVPVTWRVYKMQEIKKP